jgi:hypothetical protein
VSEVEVTKPEQKKPVPVNKGQPSVSGTFTNAPANVKPAKGEVLMMEEPAASHAGSAIPVRLVYFSRPVQYPGKGQGSEQSARTLKESGGRSWAVFFIPSLRHFRIEFNDPSRGIAGQVGYVHESVALSWEPVA